MPNPTHDPAFRRRLTVLAATASLLVVGCNYSFRAGSGFPDYIQTMAILPFENETNRFEVTDALYQQMLQDVPRSLGVQPSSEETADAVVRGVITGYSVSTPSYTQGQGDGGAQVLQRQVTIRVQVQIVDLQEGVILWESSALSADGQYLEASETEAVARQEAIELLVQSVVDGAQSNW